MDWINTANSILGGVNTIMGLFGRNNKYSAAQAAKDQFNYNMQLQKDAQNYNTYMYQNRYQMQTKDLKAAGINPLYGLGSAPSVISGQGSTGMPEYVAEQQTKENRKQNKINNALNMLSFMRDYSAVNAENNLKKAQTATEGINAQLRALQTIGQQLENTLKQKDINSYDKRLISDLKEAQSRIIANLAGAESSSANAYSARENAKYTKERSKTEIQTRESIERVNKWHKKHPILSELGIGGNELKGASDVYKNTIGDLIKTIGKNGNQRKYNKK